MAKEKNKAFGPKITTGECFASFPKLAKPDTSKFGQNKFAIDGIFVDKDQMRTLVEGCKAHAKEFYGTIEGVKFPWKDGTTATQSKYQGYEGHHFITTRSTNKPLVVDGNRRPIEPEKVYGGAIVRLNVTPLAYEKDQTVIVVEDGERKEVVEKIKGMTVLLNAVQFVRDSDRFGGEPSDGFDDSYATEQGTSDPSEMF